MATFTLKEEIFEAEGIAAPEVADGEGPADRKETFEDPSIEKIHVDVEAALKLFGNRLLNADNADFSDALTNRHHKGFGSGQYVLEIVGPAYAEKETVDQKMRRLRCEIEELFGEVEQEKQKDTANVSIPVNKADLNSLNDLLKAASLALDPSTAAASTRSSNHSKTTAAVGSGDASAPTDELRGLDERVKRIEQAVTGDGESLRPHRGPLVETIENLRVQVESLNPVYLDGVNQNLGSAISKLNEYDDKRSKVHNDELEQKIVKLYDMVSEWNVTCANVPAVVKRLHTLSKLHEQAQEFAARLSSVTGLKQHLEHKVENQRLMLFELKRESAKIVDEFTSKVQELHKRMAALEQQ